MATTNRDFRVKNGIVVEGSTATVNGNNVLTTASSLDSLGDVVITSATTDQVLKYNGTNWVNGTTSGGGGATTLDGLTDVAITTPATNSFLQYSGTEWIDSGQTLTLSGNTTIGSSTHTVAFLTSGNTSVTLPTSGTLATTSDLSSYLTTATASTTYAALSGATFTGNIAINNSTSTALTTTGTTAALFNANATTLNIGGAATTVSLGAATGTTTINNALTVTGNITGAPAAPTNATSAARIGYVGMPQVNNPASPYTLSASDAGKHIYMTTTGRTITIPANGSVPLEIGTTVVIINGNSVSTTISITTDTLRLANTTSTGTRTLASNGMATLVKVTSTEWIINGTGLT